MICQKWVPKDFTNGRADLLLMILGSGMETSASCKKHQLVGQLLNDETRPILPQLVYYS
jgi:hypothetical protein